MSQPQSESISPRFERRYYEALRRQALAPAIGKIGIEGAQELELQVLKRRRRTEMLSTLAESIKPEQVRSVIDTHYVIEMRESKLVAEDGEPIEDMLSRALEADRELAAKDDFFEPFLVKQTEAETGELREWEAMARGETDYNTLITFSGYREEYDDGTEAAHKKLKRAGQKPYWRRGMFRVAHAEDGEVHIFNYSVDNCSVELMQEVARQEFGYDFEADNSTGMLGERVRRQVNDDSWRFIATRLVAHGDRILSQKYGGTWKHGYNPSLGIRRAQTFVESQAQIVDSLLRVDERLARQHSSFETYCSAFEQELYDCIALLEERLDKGREDEPVVDYESAASGAGAIARAAGREYDACGVVISGARAEAASIAAQTGFESLLRLEGKKVSCPECKKKVIVPRKDLEAGRLTCSDCGYRVDVCTGKTSRKGRPKIKQPGVLDVLGAELRRYSREIQQKRQVDSIKERSKRRAA